MLTPTMPKMGQKVFDACCVVVVGQTGSSQLGQNLALTLDPIRLRRQEFVHDEIFSSQDISYISYNCGPETENMSTKDIYGGELVQRRKKIVITPLLTNIISQIAYSKVIYSM